MARAPVPSVAFFRAKAIKPEAFVSIDDSDVLDTLELAADTVASYVNKHGKGPITDWDGACVRAVIKVAAYDLMNHRGYSKVAGADARVKDDYDATREWLKLVASGEVEPWFEDDTPNDADDGPLGTSVERSDAWTDY